jgi:protein O-mannosyl-transferase
MLRKIPYPALLVLVTFAVYALSLGHRFVLYDDDLHIFRNPILKLPTLDAISYFWSSAHQGFYIPMTYTVWALLTKIAKPSDPNLSLDHLNPMPYHAANILFHLINVIALYYLLARLTKNSRASFLGALLFALHPLQVESVAWATGLKDILAVTFSLCASFFYFKALERKPGGVLASWLGTGAIFYLLGVLCKPAVITLPLVLSVFAIIFLNFPWKRAAAFSALYCALSSPLIFMTSKLQPIEFNMFHIPFWAKPLIAIDAFVFYLWKMILPLPLVHDYSRNPEWVLGNHIYLLTGAVFLFLVFAAWKSRSRILQGCLLAFGLSLLPVSGIVQFSFQNFSTVADHYMYFPMISLSVALAYWAMHESWLLKSSWKPVGYFGLLGLLSFFQMRLWSDSERLLYHTISESPRSVLARNNLGVYYEWVQDWEKALDAYLNASKVGPRFVHHYYNVGNLYMRTNRLPQAVEYLRKTIEIQPKYSEAHFNLGLIGEANGDLAYARKAFETAILNDPLMFKAHIKLATTLNKLGHWEEARARFEHGLQLNPLSPQAHQHYAKALEAHGLNAEAKWHFQEAQRLQPYFDANRTPVKLIRK